MQNLTEQLFEKNMALLKSRMSCESFEAMTAFAGVSPVVVENNDDCGNAHYALKGDSRLLLHSRRDPDAEAERQVALWGEKEKVDWAGMIVVSGFAGMHHLKALTKRMLPGSELFVADLFPAAVLEVLKTCHLSCLEKKDIELRFSVSDDFRFVSDEFRWRFMRRKKLNVSFFVHPGCLRAFKKEYDRLSLALIKESRLEGLNRGTKASFSSDWHRNSLKNLPFILNTPGIAPLKGAFKGRSAIVVGAGPSLDDALAYIKKCEDKAVVIAVGTALKSLLKAGIRPDFVVVIEWLPMMLNQFSGLEKADIEGIHLLVEPIVDPRLLEMFEGSMFLFSSKVLCHYNEWLRSIGALPDSLIVGGTVTVTAIDAAIFMGCSELIMVGFDLAFRDDGSTHASFSMYDGVKMEKSNLVEVAGNYGRNVFTKKIFRSYIEVMNAYSRGALKTKRVKFYNAATAGALLDNMKVIHPSQIPELLSSDVLEDKRSFVKGRWDVVDLPDMSQSVEAIDKALKELYELSHLAESAVNVCAIVSESNENLQHSRRLEVELNRLDGEMQKLHIANLLVNDALQATIMGLYSDDEGGALIDQIKKGGDFYMHIKNASNLVIELLIESKRDYLTKKNNL